MKTRKKVFSIAFIIVCIDLAAPIHTKVDKDSIIGIRLFDEGITDGVKDTSDNGHDGPVKGTPKVIDGKFGKPSSLAVSERSSQGLTVEVSNY